MPNLQHYKKIAELFAYPDQSFGTKVRAVGDNTYFRSPIFKEKFKVFVDAVEKLGVKEQKEYYSKTFDVQAVCYLDIGYMMFGEDYKRAQMLVNLQKEHEIAGLDCGSELSDHLPNVLRLLAETRNMEFAEELGFIILIPAVKFMLTKFKNIDNYYKILLEVLLEMLQNDFKGDELTEFAFPEESFSGKNEFLMPSPKMTICDSNCKQKRF
jgi:nitrate reductase assembly molybdenum cofactor insertion protein NarJ